MQRRNPMAKLLAVGAGLLLLCGLPAIVAAQGSDQKYGAYIYEGSCDEPGD